MSDVDEKDGDGEREFGPIATMLIEAEKHGMEVEVVWSFANELRSGEKDLGRAAAAALHEWDI